ncbi:hypothetical protein CLNEO_06350 [Anaerotignum neopropionicum]|uniref:Uncharacterized protein n=1 Tax=Anaerotignum neopropionicum TaxID=36847 RepID=A0A136WIX6_9FIRM|nr:hypothetical protein [Anaerotignum neopropionicum]KXL54528.1 hypothetical protein CLNEO_06350 [Anaerotignum neopropionicum]
MEEQRKEGQELADTSVDKEIKSVESNVDEAEQDVDNMGTKQAAVDNNLENVDNSVEKQVKDGDGSVETEVEPVDFYENEDENDGNTVEEPVENVDNSAWDVENNSDVPNKKGGIWWKIVLGLVVFAGFLGYCWYATGGGFGKNKDIALTYAKDNGLYIFDLKNEPYLVNDSISVGGEYNYYYSAWGAMASEDNEALYYLVGINEDNVGNLYYKNIKNKESEGVIIAENVFHFITSTDGKECVYLVKNGAAIDLYLYRDGQSRLISDGILQQNGAYDLSEDGSYILFRKSNNDQVALYASVIGQEEPIKLSDSVVLDLITQKTNVTYYLEQQGDSYQLFKYAPGNAPQLVAEKVTYAELMPNGQDVLYCAMRAKDSDLAQLIEDDITDLSAYDEKRQAEIQEMRSKMSEEEGLDPIFQDCYVITSAGTKKIQGAVVSAVSLEGKSGFVVGYSMDEPQAVKLSEISSFDEALYAYYSELMYGEKQVFVADKAGNVYTLQDKGVDPTSIKVSNDGKIAAYFVQGEQNGENVLMVKALDGKSEAVEVQKGVETISFLGDSEALAYFYNYNGGLGSVGLFAENASQEIAQNAVGFYTSTDRKEMFYLAELDTTTGRGTLIQYDGKEKQEIDQDVFSFQYKENGKLAYLKNYDINKEIGDLYYYDGKTTRLVDSGVTAIYMY